MDSFQFPQWLQNAPFQAFPTYAEPLQASTSLFSFDPIEQRKIFLRAQVAQITQLKALYLEKIKEILDSKKGYETPEISKTFRKNSFDMRSYFNEPIEVRDEELSRTSSELVYPIFPGYSNTVPLMSFPSSQSLDQSYMMNWPVQEQKDYNGFLVQEIESIIRFAISNFGKVNQEEIFDNARKRYLSHPVLVEIFDRLIKKYQSLKKCKEDMVRYVIRKAFKVIKTNISNQEKMYGKNVSHLLCKRYFPNSYDEIRKNKEDVSDSDRILDVVMPYQKTYKNKALNSSFVKEIFSSAEFCSEYQRFLEAFHETILEDNEKKIENFKSFLVECVEKDQISKLSSFSRLPWVDVWMNEAENVAVSLLDMQKGFLKKEEYC